MASHQYTSHSWDAPQGVQLDDAFWIRPDKVVALSRDSRGRTEIFYSSGTESLRHSSSWGIDKVRSGLGW